MGAGLRRKGGGGKGDGDGGRGKGGVVWRFLGRGL